MDRHLPTVQRPAARHHRLVGWQRQRNSGGGSIRAATRPEGGALFTLTLPREEPPDIPQEEAQP